MDTRRRPDHARPRPGPAARARSGRAPPARSEAGDGRRRCSCSTSTAPRPGTYGELEPAHPPLIDGAGPGPAVVLPHRLLRQLPPQVPLRLRRQAAGQAGPAPVVRDLDPQRARGLLRPQAARAARREDELLGFLYDGWDTSGFADLPREEQLGFYRHAQDVLRRYHRAGRRPLPPARRRPRPGSSCPSATRRPSSARSTGSTSTTTARFHVIDYKTNRKVKDRARVAGSLQLSLYALACRHLYGALPAHGQPRLRRRRGRGHRHARRARPRRRPSGGARHRGGGPGRGVRATPEPAVRLVRLPGRCAPRGTRRRRPRRSVPPSRSCAPSAASSPARSRELRELEAGVARIADELARARRSTTRWLRTWPPWTVRTVTPRCRGG